MFSLLLTRTPRSISARLLLSHTNPSLYCDLWLCCPGYRLLHLSLFILFCQEVWTFLGVQFFGESCETLKNSWVWHSMITAWGPAADWSLGGENNCLAYTLFCTFIIFGIISSSSISFVACIRLNPQVSSFVHSSSPSPWGGRGNVSKQLSNA